MKMKVIYIALAILLIVGFVGCSVGNYTISTDSFKRSVFLGGSQVAGITFVSGEPMSFRVQLGGFKPFLATPEDAVKVGYNNRSIFSNQNHTLHIGIVVTPPVDKLGEIEAAVDSWDYSEWNWNWENNNWSNVNEKVVLIKLSPDKKKIILEIR